MMHKATAALGRSETVTREINEGLLYIAKPPLDALRL